MVPGEIFEVRDIAGSPDKELILRRDAFPSAKELFGTDQEIGLGIIPDNLANDVSVILLAANQMVNQYIKYKRLFGDVELLAKMHNQDIEEFVKQQKLLGKSTPPLQPKLPSKI